MLDYGFTLIGWCLGTLLLGVVFGVVGEAIVEAYREADPLAWFRGLVERVSFLRRWSECGFCFSNWIVVAIASVAFFLYPGYVLSIVVAAPIGWRFSNWWHDRISLQQLTKDSLKGSDPI